MIKEVSFKFTSNAKDIENQLKTIDRQIAKLQNSRHELQIKATQLDVAQKKMKSLDVSIAKLQAQKAEVKISGLPADKAKEKIQQLQKGINSLQAQKATLKVETTQLKGADTELNKVNRQMTSLNNRKASLQVQQEHIGEANAGLEKVERSLSKLNSSRTNINISSNIQKIGGAIDGLGSKMLGALNPFASKLNQLVGAGLILKGISKAFDMVTSSAGSAISRIDTMRNFPNVMSNMNISAKDSAAAIDMISDKLDGLPTALDDAALSVQRFTSKNKDINRSSRMFLALNNAVLAGAAPAEKQTTAIEQMTQAYSKGKMDITEWYAIQQAAPAQLDQVAQAFGKTQDGLYEALKKGKISMDSFMDKIIELNEVGTGEFESFEEQARKATGGIQTSLKNMGTAVTRGLTKVMLSFDKILGNTEFGSIGGMFSKIGKSFDDGLGKIAELVEKNEDKIIGFVDTVQEKFTWLWAQAKNFDWKSLFEGLKESFNGIRTTIKTMWDTAQPILGYFKDKITELGGGNFAKGLGKLPEYFIKTAVGLKVVGTALKGLGAFTGVIGKLTGFSLGSLFGGKGDEVKTTTFDTGKMLTQFKNLALIAGVIGSVMLAAEAIKQVNDKVPNNLGGVAKKMGIIVLAIGAMGALVAVAGKLTKGGGMKTALAGLVTVALIAVELMVCAEALKQVNSKVPSNIGQVAKKLANIGIAITAMGVLAGVIGLAMVGTGGIAALAVGGGLLVIAGIAGDLILMAEAIDDINTKVPEDFCGVETKLDNITKVIEKMASLELGGLFGMLETVVNTIHVEVVSTLVETMVKLSGKLKSFETAVEDIPTLATVNERLGQITPIIEAIQEQDFGTVLDALALWGAKLAIGGLTETVEKLTAIATHLKDFARASYNLPTDTGAKMQQIQWIIKAINAVKLDNLTNKGNFPAIVEGTAQLKSIAESLNGLGKITIESASVNLRIIAIGDVITEMVNLKTRIDEITESDTFFKGASLNTIARVVEELVALSTKLSEFGVEPIKSAMINLKIQAIRDVFAEMALIDPDGVSKIIDKLATANTATASLGDLVKRFEEFAKVPFDSGAVSMRITEIKNIIRAQLQDFPTADGQGGSLAMVDHLIKIVEQLQELSTSFFNVGDSYGTSLVAGFNSYGLPKELGGLIGKVVTELEKLDKKFTNIGEKYGEALKKRFGERVKDMSDAVNTEITKIAGLNARLQTIGNTLGTSLMRNFSDAIQNMARDVGVQIDAIQRAVNNLNFSSMSVIPRTGNIGSVGYATGGEVQYRASGGIMQPKGTDTVPAMLTPGEFVIRKQAVDAMGTPFMQRLNKLDIQGAFRQLTGNFNGKQMTQRTVHSVVNNVHTDNRQNKPNIKMTTNGGANYSFRRLNKYARGLA